MAWRDVPAERRVCLSISPAGGEPNLPQVWRRSDTHKERQLFRRERRASYAGVCWLKEETHSKTLLQSWEVTKYKYFVTLLYCSFLLFFVSNFFYICTQISGCSSPYTGKTPLVTFVLEILFKVIHFISIYHMWCTTVLLIDLYAANVHLCNSTPIY